MQRNSSSSVWKHESWKGNRGHPVDVSQAAETGARPPDEVSGWLFLRLNPWRSVPGGREGAASVRPSRDERHSKGTRSIDGRTYRPTIVQVTQQPVVFSFERRRRRRRREVYLHGIETPAVFTIAHVNATCFCCKKPGRLETRKVRLSIVEREYHYIRKNRIGGLHVHS